MKLELGLHGFTETMRGTWTPSDGSGRKILWFRVEADATSALAYLRRGEMLCEGTLFAEGLAEGVPARGMMEVQPLGGRIAYRLDFRGDDGKSYRFSGEKTPTLKRLVQSMTTLPGEIVLADGEPIGTALLRFDRKDLLPFLRTFRPARLGAAPRRSFPLEPEKATP
jgi:hypothetical protein